MAIITDKAVNPLTSKELLATYVGSKYAVSVRYAQGKNISAFLRDEEGAQFKTEEIIEISYDLQTGNYIAAMEDEARAKRNGIFASKYEEVMRTGLQ